MCLRICELWYSFINVIGLARRLHCYSRQQPVTLGENIMALTTDFSGTYDYEKTEAEHAANTILEDVRAGYFTDRDGVECAVKREMQHWAKYLDVGFSEFQGYFYATLTHDAIDAAFKVYQDSTESK